MKFLKSFVFAGAGIKHCFKNELNFRVHILATALAVILGICLKISSVEWLFIIGCCMLVLGMEMLNSAIEKTCDLLHNGYHPLVKVIKDLAAGAVLVCALGSAITGAVIFLPKIFHQLNMF